MNNIEKPDFIEVILENCEVFRFKYSDFSSLYIKNITENVYMLNDYNNFYESERCAKTIAFKLKIESNTKDKDLTNFSEIQITPLKRISDYNDIVYLSFVYNDNKDKNINIYVKWNIESSINNSYQKSFLSKDGLYVVISKKEDLKDYFVYDLFDEYEGGILK